MKQPHHLELIEDLFRRESAHLVAALTRVLGPGNIALAEDVVHDALISAMQAWRFGMPDNPNAWILQTAKNRAVDLIRRERRFENNLRPKLEEGASPTSIDQALSPEADAENQLVMMFAICDEALSTETHVTLILRLLCGLSPTEIARAFLVDDVQTIDRRLHRGRAHLQALGAELPTFTTFDQVRARQPSVEQAIYLLFNEGYHGSDPNEPLHPAICADAIRFAELLLAAEHIDQRSVHALAALFCVSAARLSTRVDQEGVIVPLADQDRSRWDQQLIARGIEHLGLSASGDSFTRWHLEAGIAFEHTTAKSIETTNWQKVVQYYDALIALSPTSPIFALNRGLAIAELRGLDEGRQALAVIADDPKLARYSFFWAARADIERRAKRFEEARGFYERAIHLAKSRSERVSYERRVLSVLRTKN
jgi:RNA polymerase sigma factor (sigma-70 family)